VSVGERMQGRIDVDASVSAGLGGHFGYLAQVDEVQDGKCENIYLREERSNGWGEHSPPVI
jgi:hypothetical protein